MAAFGCKADENLKDLKSKVKDVLADLPDGVNEHSFWNCFRIKHNFFPEPKDFGVQRRSELLSLCKETYTTSTNSKGQKILKLKGEASVRNFESSYSKLKSSVVENQKVKQAARDNKLDDKKNPVQVKSKSGSHTASTEVQEQLDSEAMKPKVQNNVYYNRHLDHSNAGPYPRGSRPHHMPGQAIQGGHVPYLYGNPPYGMPPFHYNPFMDQMPYRPPNYYGPPMIPPIESQNFNQNNNPVSDTSADPVASASGESRGPRNASSAKNTGSSPLSTPKKKYPRDQLNSVAEDCIERLSESKEYVSLERIEKLLLQHFDAESLSRLGLRQLDELNSVKEHLRLECKVNLYTQNFVKIRPICSVYELNECLKDFTESRQDFETLRLGPLTKMPLVYEFFKVSTDKDICEIKATDILDYLRNWLTENKLWTSSNLSLQEFLQYIMEKRGLSTPYDLGVRINSLVLGIQILKKSQRDYGQSIRDVSSKLGENAENDLDAAFRQFLLSVLHKETGICRVRQEYLSMTPTNVILVVFTKLRLMYTMINDYEASWDAKARLPTHNKARKTNKLLQTLDEFKNLLQKDTLLQRLMMIAICCSQEQIHHQLIDIIEPNKSRRATDVITIDSSPENIPNASEVIAAIHKYMERCIAHGALTLERLSQIEEKLIQDFHLQNFIDLNQGAFLQFLLQNEEIKKHLDECGGTLLGSSSHGTNAESCFHASLDDLVDFVSQCAYKEPAQHRNIEMAICHHYSVKDVKSLGHGSISHLVKAVEKQQHHPGRSSCVFYANALTAKQFPTALSTDRNTGLLGHRTKDQALVCLQNCPLLEDLAQWSQWDLVYKPELKELSDFIQKYGGTQMIPLTGGSKKMVSTSILALEVRPGMLLKLTNNTSPQIFAEAAEARDVTGTCGHLVSLIAINRGLENTPLALLGNHFKSALLKMTASCVDVNGKNGQKDKSTEVVQFVLECIVKIPLVISYQVINQVFLDGLSYVIGQTKSKEQLLSLVQTAQQKSHLQALGMLLGIREWSESFQQQLIPSADCLVDVESMEGNLAEIISVDSEPEDECDSSESEFSLDNNEEEEEEEDEEQELADNKMNQSKDPETSKLVDVTKGSSETVLSSDVLSTTLVDDSKGLSEMDCETASILKCDNNMQEADGSAVATRSQVDSEMLCKQLIEQIRQEEFGFNVELNEDGTRLLTKQQERLGRSLERLSRDLYSKDTHFVLELIQNADDNEYTAEMMRSVTDDVPSVKFIVDQDCVVILNNEIGFKETNIRAICDVGRSTKGKHKFGYIGQKGIGFKSVFRVTNRPEIHSNGYHIRFDANSKPLGYILPEWISDDQRDFQPPQAWRTCIALPLKQEMKDHHQTLSLAARFRDIDPSLLLFLHRLRRIEVINKVEGYESTMRRTDLGENRIEIRHKDGVDRWLVVRKTLDATKISMTAKSGIDVESTEIALAFPMMTKDDMLSKILPSKQPVFAFLPLRSYGFRFVIQGDFDVPSSREEVDQSSMWNQFLSNEIPDAFVSALEVFKIHSEFDAVEAICYFLQFVPQKDEILGFFDSVADNILNQLKARPCLPSQSMQWKLPSQLVVTGDSLVREVMSGSLLREHLGLDFLHRDVLSLLNLHLLHSLGVQSLNTHHLIEVGKSIVAKLNTMKDISDEIIQTSKWLLCVFKSMDEFRTNDDIITALRSLKMIPLANGEVVSIESRTIFFPLSTLEKDAVRKNLLTKLESDMCTIHPLLLGANDNIANSQLCCLLQQLGIKKLTPLEVIHHHILPSLRSPDVESKGRDLLITYMVYIKEHWLYQQSLLDLNELRDVAIVVTNHGLKRPHQEPVHFSKEYYNIKLQDFPGMDWVLLDRCYINGACTHHLVHEWRDFMSRLGVLDFLAIRQKKLIMKPSELANSLWLPYKEVLPALDEYHILDSRCEEFEAIVTRNSDPVSMIDQMKCLFEQLDKLWDTEYKKHTVAQITDSRGNLVKEVESSFSINLKSLEWIPATLDGVINLDKGSNLFVDLNDTRKLMANHVSYIIPAIINTSSFAHDLGIQYEVNVEFVRKQLLKWSARSQDETRNPRCFTTTVLHMKSVYEYLTENLVPKQTQELFDHPVIFYTSVPSLSSPVDGFFLRRQEVRWSDPSGLFDKYRDALSSLDSEGNSYRVNIAPLYRGMEDIFLNRARIQKTPEIMDYVELLIHISLTSSVQRALPDVLLLFSLLGKQLEEGDALLMKPQLDRAVNAINDNKVIPNKSGKWIGLKSKPMIADDKQLEKLFMENGELEFVDCGEKLGIGQPRVSKDLENINLDHMMHFLVSVGVEKLRSCVSIDCQTEMYHPCPSLQRYVGVVLPYIQCQVHCYPHIYDYLVNEKRVGSKLATMQFAQVTKLELIHSLRNLPDVVPVVFPQKCRLINDHELYVHCDHVTAYNEINKELARYFSCSGISCPDSVSRRSNECFSMLKNLLTEVLPLIQCHSPELDTLIEKYDIQKLPETEERWKVPEPLILFTQHYASAKPSRQFSSADDASISMELPDKEATDTKSETTGIKSWPPLSHSGGLQPGSKASSGKVTQMWPPPAPPQYLDRTQLPANIRASSLDRINFHRQNSNEKDGLNDEASEKERSNIQTNATDFTQTSSDLAQQLQGPADLSLKSKVQAVTMENITSDMETSGTDGASEPVVIEFTMPAQEKLMMQMPLKRKRVHSGESANDYARPSTKHLITSHFYGPPVWLARSDENVFDHLGSADALQMPSEISISEDSDTTAIGMWGELLVKNFLEKSKAEAGSQITEIIHCNEQHETGRPYDFIIHQMVDNSMTEVFIEVKTTLSSSKACFEISLNQLLFAHQHGQSYHLYRVYSAGNSKEVRLAKIENLKDKMLRERVRLMMII